MLIHLETGRCASQTTEEILDDIADECPQSRKYIIGNRRCGWIYACPSCDSKFRKLSALYQHAEDVAGCEDILYGVGCLAILMRFIARSV